MISYPGMHPATPLMTTIFAGLGRELHLFTEESHAIILAGAILSILVNPLLFTALGRINGNLPADPESA
ncbi:hypothetical protein DLM76_13580 [Leptospira yasudae]|uniref:hypothetical protein n=1 Tax=Leptospira yasudae TaxID=2202201 RepID=UPI000E59E71F|nr:hypothetical protein [Leptospira yasudae]RHX94000.1 hypothetical protein DLM76_13580 [Leptospira yasudae]